MLKFEDPVPMRVYHPQFGECDVMAYCVVDAKTQASTLNPGASWADMRVAVAKDVLQKAITV